MLRMPEFVALLGEDNMPLSIKRGRKFGLTSASLDATDFKSTAIDLDLATGTATDAAFPTAKAVKDYVDSQTETSSTLIGLNDTAVGTGDSSSHALGDNNHFQYDGTTSKWTNRPYLEFDSISEPTAAGTGEARLYLKELNSANDALAIKLKKAGNTVEVQLTSPGAICGECGSEDGAKDPTFNFMEGIIIVELYCGHVYQMDIPNLRKIQ